MATITLDELARNVDQFFLLTMGMIVLFMQCGFAFLEAGAVRSKNSTNILIKNALDQFISGIAYWIFGYAFAFGSRGNAFIGYWNFSLSWLDETSFAFFFFQFVFAATAATIVSGALAERCHFVAYLSYSFFLTAFIYPVVTHWVWTQDGWLTAGFKFEGNDVRFRDYAGSGVLHIVGGAASFAGTTLMGPRLGRFEGTNVIPIRGHSVPFAALGGFILFFGFLAFNGGSQGSIVSHPDDGRVVAVSIVNTVICGSFSAITTLVLNRFGIGKEKKWSLLISINGGLAGMVAACAGANVYHPWMCTIVGLFASLSYLLLSWLMQKMKIDDPLDAVAVHFGGGLWGVIAVAFFSRYEGLVYQRSAGDLRHAGVLLGWQIVGAVAITAWAGFLAGAIFGILKLLGYLRVSEEIEIKGLDIPKHGEPAYPLEAYGHGWIESMQLVNVLEKRKSTTVRRMSLDTTVVTIRHEPMEFDDSGNYETPETRVMKDQSWCKGIDNGALSTVDEDIPMDLYVEDTTGSEQCDLSKM